MSQVCDIKSYTKGICCPIHISPTLAIFVALLRLGGTRGARIHAFEAWRNHGVCDRRSHPLSNNYPTGRHEAKPGNYTIKTTRKPRSYHQRVQFNNNIHRRMYYLHISIFIPYHSKHSITKTKKTIYSFPCEYMYKKWENGREQECQRKVICSVLLNLHIYSHLDSDSRFRRQRNKLSTALTTLPPSRNTMHDLESRSHHFRTNPLIPKFLHSWCTSQSCQISFRSTTSSTHQETQIPLF